MTDILTQIEEIQKNVREMKATWGNTITMLDNIKTSLKADNQKAKDVAYQKGLDDAWELARKLVWGFSLAKLQEMGFNIPSHDDEAEVLKMATVQEAISKLKAYEEKKDDTIRVGDEVKQNGDKGVCVKIYNDTIRVMWADGSSCRWKLSSDLQKTGKHFDIESILEALKE